LFGFKKLIGVRTWNRVFEVIIIVNIGLGLGIIGRRLIIKRKVWLGVGEKRGEFKRGAEWG
jgi:hypothetical protein